MIIYPTTLSKQKLVLYKGGKTKRVNMWSA